MGKSMLTIHMYRRTSQLHHLETCSTHEPADVIEDPTGIDVNTICILQLVITGSCASPKCACASWVRHLVINFPALHICIHVLCSIMAYTTYQGENCMCFPSGNNSHGPNIYRKMMSNQGCG